MAEVLTLLMKTRIISGVLAAVALFVIMAQPPLIISLTVFAVSIVSLYEFYQSVRKVYFHPVRIVGFFSCIMLLLYSMYHVFSDEVHDTLLGDLSRVFFQRNMFYLIIYLVTIYLLLQLVFRRNSFNLEDVAVTLLGVVYIPFLLSFLFLIRFLNYGFELTWLVFVGAFSTDIFAYFIGKFFGKTKLLPKISPNKTVAGAVGGIVGSVVCTVAYGLFYANGYAGMQIAFYHYILLGLLCGTVGQLGDWAASAIKRSVGIKDFGHIIPGHGGLLDRIDSLLFVAPAVYFYLQFVII
jgi:phosphatidate cytidylyltransferase